MEVNDRQMEENTSVKNKLREFLKGKDTDNHPVTSTPKYQGSNTETSAKKGVKRRLVPYDGSYIFDPLISNLPDHLTYKHFTENGINFLEISRRETDILEANGGPLAGARVVISDDGTGYFQCHGTPKDPPLQNCLLDKDLYEQLIGKLGQGYHYCCGIPKDTYVNKATNVGYKPKHYTEQSFPFPAVYSDNCQRWFSSKQPNIFKENGQKSCPKCTAFLRYVRRSNKRNDIPKSTQMQRLKASSHFPYKFLSLRSVQTRLNNSRRERLKSARKAAMLHKRIARAKMTLEDDQNKEMSDIVSVINSMYGKDLEQIWREAEEKNGKEARSVLEDIWNHDTQDRKDFFADQTHNMTGNTGNTWSTATYRIALAIYVRIPAAYEALRSFKVLQLPGISSLKQFKGARPHPAGINQQIQEYVVEQSNNYRKYKDEVRRKGSIEPLGEGILIFDAVKVTSRVQWSSASQKMIGLALTDEEFYLLNDIYDEFDPRHEPVPAEYNLQFLWRDITSNFDVVGSYFASAVAYDHRFIIASIKEAMRLFQGCHFSVIGLVCDGASSNLAAIKLLCNETRGAFQLSSQEDEFAVEPWFINDYEPTLRVYCCICPSHQLKNMINALYQSRVSKGGTKLFKVEENKPFFGWQTIRDLFKREEDRRRAGQLSEVPGLKQHHIDRDPWTKLAVYPAKIMQQSEVLCELFKYLNPPSGPPPNDHASVSQTRDYLQACNLLFEKGFLSHNKITASDSEVLKNISNGYSFFTNWHHALKDYDFHPISPKEKRFLAWQTFDLLRICVYGFREFCADFLRRHPNHYVLPLKWNGSAVETLFSQFKFEQEANSIL